MIILEAILIISKRQVAYDLARKKILFQMIFACTVCITITSSILGTTRHSNHIKLQSCLQRRAKRDFHAFFKVQRHTTWSAILLLGLCNT